MLLKKLTSPYWAFAFALVFNFAPKAFERWLADQDWWKDLPFGWLSLIFLAVGVGVVWEDLRNPNSNLREIWRDYRRIFDVMVVDAGHEFAPFEFYNLRCRLKFRKNVRKAVITVRVVPLHPQTSPTVVHSEVLQDVPKDFEKELRYGSMAINRPGALFARHSVWGGVVGGQDLLPEQKTIIGLARYMVEVSVNHQIYRIYADTRYQGTFEHPGIFLLKEELIPKL